MHQGNDPYAADLHERQHGSTDTAHERFPGTTHLTHLGDVYITKYTYVFSPCVMIKLCALQTFMNAHGVGEVALAGATSNLFATLADSYRRAKFVQAGDEIIIHNASHEVCTLAFQHAWLSLSSASCHSRSMLVRFKRPS